MQQVRTTCAYCGVGCGVVATAGAGRSVTIAGDGDHPANRGRLCSKGTHLGETVGLEGRLLHPEVAGKRTTWDKAIRHVARGFARAIADHGPDSVAFYVSGQLLTEDYYVANKLMKGFIGSANIDTNSRLCMSSAVAAHNRAFGEDVVPCTYEDLDEADLIVLVGSNTAWCHPVVYQRIVAARATRGTKVVVIDPRRTETCADADLHLALRPGSDVALMNGLLAHCRKAGLVDEVWCDAHLSVPGDFWAGLEGATLPETARQCDLAEADLAQFYALFAASPRSVTLFSQGINQSVRGTDQGNAIINLHLATGRIGKPGTGPFSITGQPNAMGGREVGGLATTLAAHRDFAEVNRTEVQRFWASPRIAGGPGLKAVDLFRQMREGRIKALWIMATNPAVSMPDAALVREALARCPLVVVSDCIAETDTSRQAQVKLPALAWGEKDGTVTNSDRTISRQRGFLAAPGEARPDWWIVGEVAKAMGWAEHFTYDSAAAIFREHARLSTYRNAGKRLFDIGHLAAISNADYDALEPQRWGGRPFADGRFPAPDGKARLIPVEQRVLDYAPLERWPLTLNTGRYRDQWHTMTRTGLSPRLSQHRREPQVDMHPADAAALDLADGVLARVATPQGESVFRVALNDGQRRGEIFTPIHWTDRQSSGGRTGLLPCGMVDPHSGQPAFKQTPARIEALPIDWHGFAVLRKTPARIPAGYVTRVRVAGGWLIELAGVRDPGPLAETLLPAGDRLDNIDAARGVRRLVLVEGAALVGAVYLTRSGPLPDRDWIVSQLLDCQASPVELLAGRPAKPLPDRGAQVCVCFDVGEKQITAAALAGASTLEAVGAATCAGTNCGSCRPAIARLLEAALTQQAEAAE
ncbi:assimilatory nitrate reductase (NADH) alpha subunit apoprotein [Novosphingobium kunmingense]|uniref:Assimilatory nitrate reductase (NADH) alpha subunit apoprotein n=1 Tax=Novosphingobium kunmingense TaxID=1211806 RepID=A0A2N0H685_9SPHN|nr:nitrate reductase [Novosphingobium kunmingense]PKB14453.1 assimilatory nitrate reductase (NADH) alpha subunit apoprotein [Novosphingobium kunmingense]